MKRHLRSKKWERLVAAALAAATLTACAIKERISPKLTLISDQHVAYISGIGGTFGPEKPITRAEAAQIFLRLLPERPSVTETFTDVPADHWYAEAAGTMGTLGVMRQGMETFQPDEPMTRAEFVTCLAKFFKPQKQETAFSDVPEDHWAYEAACTAQAYGWVEGYGDGSFGPDRSVTRAEAVVILNRALGRSVDRTYVDEFAPVCWYPDLSSDHWAYGDVVEASVPHQFTYRDGAECWTSHEPVLKGFSDGLQMIDGWLYCYDEAQGDLLRNTTKDGLTFGPNGRFTSGNARLDEKLRNIVLEQTDDSMTREEQLRALYVYTRDSFIYLRRPAYAFGVTDFMERDALDMLTTGQGNCYSYASVFWYLARWLGYDAEICSGTVGRRRSPHAWVEIAFEGENYIFDTELEMAYHKKGQTQIDLYKYIDVDGWQYRKP